MFLNYIDQSTAFFEEFLWQIFSNFGIFFVKFFLRVCIAEVCRKVNKICKRRKTTCLYSELNSVSHLSVLKIIIKRKHNSYTIQRYMTKSTKEKNQYLFWYVFIFQCFSVHLSYAKYYKRTLKKKVYFNRYIYIHLK